MSQNQKYKDHLTQRLKSLKENFQTQASKLEQELSNLKEAHGGLEVAKRAASKGLVKMTFEQYEQIKRHLDFNLQSIIDGQISNATLQKEIAEIEAAIIMLDD